MNNKLSNNEVDATSAKSIFFGTHVVLFIVFVSFIIPKSNSSIVISATAFVIFEIINLWISFKLFEKVYNQGLADQKEGSKQKIRRDLKKHMQRKISTLEKSLNKISQETDE